MSTTARYTAVVGENGSGKSTLLKLMVGAFPMNSGLSPH